MHPNFRITNHFFSVDTQPCKLTVVLYKLLCVLCIYICLSILYSVSLRRKHFVWLFEDKAERKNVKFNSCTHFVLFSFVLHKPFNIDVKRAACKIFKINYDSKKKHIWAFEWISCFIIILSKRWKKNRILFIILHIRPWRMGACIYKTPR